MWCVPVTDLGVLMGFPRFPRELRNDNPRPTSGPGPEMTSSKAVGRVSPAGWDGPQRWTRPSCLPIQSVLWSCPLLIPQGAHISTAPLFPFVAPTVTSKNMGPCPSARWPLVLSKCPLVHPALGPEPTLQRLLHPLQ